MHKSNLSNNSKLFIGSYRVILEDMCSHKLGQDVHDDNKCWGLHVQRSLVVCSQLKSRRQTTLSVMDGHD